MLLFPSSWIWQELLFVQGVGLVCFGMPSLYADSGGFSTKKSAADTFKTPASWLHRSIRKGSA